MSPAIQHLKDRINQLKKDINWAFRAAERAEKKGDSLDRDAHVDDYETYQKQLEEAEKELTALNPKKYGYYPNLKTRSKILKSKIKGD